MGGSATSGAAAVHASRLLGGLLAALTLAACLASPAAAHDPLVEASALKSDAASADLLGVDPASTHSVGVGGNTRVQMQAADQYESSGVQQEVAGILASLIHGAEMSELTVSIVTPETAMSVCGSPACYATATETMILSGEQVPGAMPRNVTVAHEYGHHVARNRSNSPWSSSDWGPKHWATYEGICQGVRAGLYFPGDGGAHYWDNPGEAFAQAFAFYHFPGELDWWWHLAEPDAGAFEAIRADVQSPWSERRLRWRGRLGPGSGSRRSKVLSIPYDGRVQAKLIGPRDANFDLILRSDNGRRLERTRARGSHEVLGYDACGVRSARLEVHRRSGRGVFRVRISTP